MNLLIAAKNYQYYITTIYVQRSWSVKLQISDTVHHESFFAQKSMHAPFVPQFLDFPHHCQNYGIIKTAFALFL